MRPRKLCSTSLGSNLRKHKPRGNIGAHTIRPLFKLTLYLWCGLKLSFRWLLVMLFWLFAIALFNLGNVGWSPMEVMGTMLQVVYQELSQILWVNRFHTWLCCDVRGLVVEIKLTWSIWGGGRIRNAYRTTRSLILVLQIIAISMHTAIYVTIR